MNNSIRNIKSMRLFKFLLFLMIYVSNDTLLFGTNANTVFNLIQYFFVAMIGLFLIMYVLKKSIKVPKPFICFYVLLLALNFASSVFNNDFNTKYVYEMIIVLIALLYASVVGVKQFELHYVDVITFLALFSLAFWAINIWAPNIISSFPLIRNTSKLSFKFCLFSNVYYSRDYTFIGYYRNYSIFREPGLFQIFLLLALFIILFFKPQLKNRVLKVLLLTIAVITTFSTAGYIVLVLEYLAFIVLNFRKISPSKLFLISILFVCALLVFLVLNDRFNIISGVFGNKIGNSDHSSWMARVSSVYSNLRIGLETPFWGAGWDGVKDKFLYYNVEIFNSSTKDNTNTLLKLLAVHGFVYFLVVVCSLYRYLKRSKSSIKPFFLLIILFVLLSNEDLTFGVITYILVFYGMATRKTIYAKVEESKNENGFLRLSNDKSALGV